MSGSEPLRFKRYMWHKIKAGLGFIQKSSVKGVILGTGYPEYCMCQELRLTNVQTLYFISENPWLYNTLLEEALCKYPIELNALCTKHNISNVYYCDDSWLNKIPLLPANITLIKYN
jgi:hypothetical protein